jgi:acetyl-CoA acyltransferase
MEDVYIVAAKRTPMGKYRGVLRNVRPDDLCAICMKQTLDSVNLDPVQIEDVYIGCANQAGEDNRNVARMSLLLAGFPVEVPGATINRLCASGMQAVIFAAREIQVGAADLVMAGGVESMTRAPWVMPKPDVAFPRGGFNVFDTSLGWRFVNPRLAQMYYPYEMGETAENVARKYEIAREDQDVFALDSHQKAVAAQDSGRFYPEIVPVETSLDGATEVVDKDEGPRRDTSLEALSRLKPVFAKDGSVTAGNSSPLSDGAAVVILASETACKRHNLKPLARFIGGTAVGVDPAYMGIGPVPAVQKLSRKTGIPYQDADLIELNEAFASQSLACIRLLDLDPAKVNVNGGAIALGHPLGCSGTRIIVTLVHEMLRRKAKLGLATMCVGVGQGVATMWELAQ